jgi:ribosomal protein S18 acetylase RimI-like enzyme
MRTECGRCHAALSASRPAYLCTSDCTFCATCYRALKYVCPNCSGELVRRPRPPRSDAPAEAPVPPPSGLANVRRASLADLDAVAPLFDAYRRFYEQPGDLAASRQFLSDRLSKDESVVFVAEDGGVPVGFTQLYPLFSSVSLGPIFILNDLFVDPRVRRSGAGTRLLEAARHFARGEGAHYMELSTAVDNPAQRLYEANGWLLDREFLHYELPTRDV